MYAFYVTGARLTANLTALNGRATATWVNTWTGEKIAAAVERPAVQVFTRPRAFGDAPGLLIVR